MLSFFKGLFRSRRRRRFARREPPTRRAQFAGRGLLALLLLSATLFFFPLRARIDPPDYLEGTISTEEIIAPIQFDVLKDPAVLEHEQAVQAESVIPIFTRLHAGNRVLENIRGLERVRRDPWMMPRLQDSLGVRFTEETQRLLALPDTGKVLTAELENILVRAEAQGTIHEDDAELLAQKPRVRLRTADGDQTIQNFQLYDARKLAEIADTRGRELFGAGGGAALAELAASLAVPNTAYDHEATERNRDAAREAVNPVRISIQKGERIVDAHERITAEHVAILSSLEEALLAGTGGGGVGSWLLPLLGRVLLVGAMVVLMGVFLRTTRPRIWADLSLVSLVATAGLITLALSAIIVRTPALSPYLIPIPFAAVLLTLLLDEVVALAAVAWLAALVGVVAGWGLPGTLVGFAGGMTAVYAVRGVKHRLEVYRAMLLIALAQVVVIAAIAFMGPVQTWSDLAYDLLWAAGGAALGTAAAMLLLPVFERAFDLVTDISLLELADLNRPIFKRMMIEANGTYHHSMVIGSLAEAAAEAVRANPLLARVGAYYHDIGKIAKSAYFGENMGKGARNPHERLTPTMSSLILESHVSEGLELAREIGLPRQVSAFIPEHQGTTLMQYFYNKAHDQDPEVDENDYRYPGPKPQCKETAIVMIADAAEATVRSLDEQSPNKIRAVLSRIMELRMQDGQLDECGLTVSDLARIREAFTHVLTGVFHGRVKYQWQKDGGEDRLGRSDSERVIHPELETGIGTRDLPNTHASQSTAPGKKARG